MGLVGPEELKGHWLRGGGPEGDVVLSSRIRLARNVAGWPFVPQLKAEQMTELEGRLQDAIQGAGIDGRVLYFNLREAGPVDRLFLVERHLISREHANSHGDRGVAVTPEETVSVMTNEEDHLRIQVLRPGLNVDETWREIDRIDNLLEQRLDYAFHGDFGYLTACPTNAGTGMRASVLLHLPALVLTRQIEKLFHAVSRIRLVVRGLYGEGTQALGDCYQISNQVALGCSEQDLLMNFRNFVPEIIRYERSVQGQLIKDDRSRLEERVRKAWEALRSARTVSTESALEQLSLVRLGVQAGLVTELDLGSVNELFILIQPGHLQKREGRSLKPSDRDVARANFIRARLGSDN